MRVIAGKARGTNLETVPGMETRPTTDRIKETLFNILQGYLPDCLFLDLFAGSGAIGIEALSRGAKQAMFVERSPVAVHCIRKNLERTHLSTAASVWRMDVLEGIRRAEREGQVFDIIFLDPPYRMEQEKRVLSCLACSRILYDTTLVVVEAALETDFSYLFEMGYELVREKRYKTNKHVFVNKRQG